MRKAQFVSPIIILTIIILSTIILSVETRINTEMQERIVIYSDIVDDILSSTEGELNYQNQLTKAALTAMSTINSSGTIINMLEQEGADEVIIQEELILKYTINNEHTILVVPYPYSAFISEQERFNTEEFSLCMETSDCTNIQECVDAYDSENVDWEPLICLIEPLRVKIILKSSDYPLTNDYPHIIWNNSYIRIG